MTPRHVTGIVLAGGISSRMGQDKSLMLFHGKPLIGYAIDALLPVCGKVIISSNCSVYDFPGIEVWPDEFPVRAPMIGLYSCLKRSLTDWNLVLSCDMPLIDHRLFTFLLGLTKGYETVIPVHGDNCHEPLCGLYNRSVLECLEQKVQAGQYGMVRFIRSTRCRLVEIDSHQAFYSEKIFSNVNSPSDFDELTDQ
jgi:molybdenum cofactor guanylyltransferase